MLDPARTFDAFRKAGVDFWTGVPDSLLKDFCAYVSDHTSPTSHVIAANEGGAVAIAGGHYLGTGNLALIYLQNSGLGNALNPLISLADPAVFGLPMILLIGWRGEPDRPDEPQHLRQGPVTLSMLEAVGIPYAVLPADEPDATRLILGAVHDATARSGPYAVVVPRGTFSPYSSSSPASPDIAPPYPITREEAIVAVADVAEGTATLIATTGKTSRELYEYRFRSGSLGEQDFLTVGSMGHASQIALGIDLASRDRPVWTLDGDGAFLMHLGGIAAIGEHASAGFKHVVLNNHVHDSVGGQPTPTTRVNIPDLARAAGYVHAASVTDSDDLATALSALRDARGPALLEIHVRPGSRDDLGRPTFTPQENKVRFMRFLAR